MEKRRVYFNEFNVLMENTIYLPFVSGLLRCYAETIPLLKENYEFMPFLFIRDNLDQILGQYENPNVAAFSVSMWNANLSMEVARKVKEKFPECLTVFGGPHIPYDAGEFFAKFPFVDVTVRGEGEQTFTSVLTKWLESKDFTGIPGISFRDSAGRCVKNIQEHVPVKELDIFPSPYVLGVFDELIAKNKGIEFQAIVETNRGCPFLCTFCFWGQGGLNKRFRFFSSDYVQKTADWLGRHHIRYVFCADSNFGMFKRDPELARYFVDAKLKYSFPEKFRVCYGKNAEESIYETAKLLAEHGLAKTITLARQSNDKETLKNIRRTNIRLDVYTNLQKRYHSEEMSTYTELILGLPGETRQTFLSGLEEILQTIIDNQVFIYHCQVLPNTELSNKEYMKMHGLITRSVPLNEVHAAIRPREITTEYEDIVIATNTMPVEDWKACTVLSWVTQLFHGIKASFFITNYLVDHYGVKYTEFLEYVAQLQMSEKLKMVRHEIGIFHKAAEALIEGNSRCRVMRDFGAIYWEPEEAAFLSISNDKHRFYEEMFELVKEFLLKRGCAVNEDELKEVVKYQEARFPDYKPLEASREYHFQFNVPEYFDKYFRAERVKLSNIPQTMKLLNAKDYNGDKKTFAREILLYGRKNNRTLYSVGVEWSNEKQEGKRPAIPESLNDAQLLS